MPGHSSVSLCSASGLADDLPKLTWGIQDHLGQHLRRAEEATSSPVPELLSIFAGRLDRQLAVLDEVELSKFRDGIVEARPRLRVFALSLTKNRDQADDLVQDTILRALRKRSSFEPGTNLNAWLFTILRNSFCTERRKRSREVADSDGEYAARLARDPEQMGKLNLRDVQAALEKIPPEQRDALLLVGVQGLPYEKAAMICGTPIGTVKSRVNRARLRLFVLLGFTAEDLVRSRLPRRAKFACPDASRGSRSRT
jgi:RNA polymerase sigma-70 factor (ECF subfamily)